MCKNSRLIGVMKVTRGRKVLSGRCIILLRLDQVEESDNI